MESLLRLLPAPQSVAVRYGVSIAMVLVTFALRFGIQERAGEYGFILFIPAITASALIFDRGSGLVALALSVGLIASLLPWHGSGDVHVAALTTFVIVCSGLVLVAEGLHKALDRAHKAEREKDLLLQEMSHRVKNKFAMISSMISLQGRGTNTPEARSALEAIGARVRVIARVHDYLQLARRDGMVEMKGYLEGLCDSLRDALQDLRPVSLHVSAVELALPPEKALSIGLMVNELVINALKYAFPDEKVGSVKVALETHGGRAVLVVEDDGIGRPEHADGSGLGTQLVTLLAAQLGGSVQWTSADPGCRVSAEFPVS